MSIRSAQKTVGRRSAALHPGRLLRMAIRLVALALDELSQLHLQCSDEHGGLVEKPEYEEHTKAAHDNDEGRKFTVAGMGWRLLIVQGRDGLIGHETSEKYFVDEFVDFTYYYF